MKKFTKLKSKLIPLEIQDIDTDMIIPAQYLTRTSSEGFGEFAFQRLRENDQNFPLNLEKYKNSEIILADRNFGCGSSREHAVWALKDWGIKVVIAPSFADIFFSNSAKNGLVLIQIPQKEVENLFKKIENSDLETTVDLANQKLIFEDKEISFPFDPFRKDCILNGYDDLDYILANEKEIDSWNQKNQSNQFINSIK
jgi:3-isopropylmalate/(R)-2-methylmalate dehydratase small subunit